ncbi:hypothetical protein [Myxococcus sp. Y35]|uniref:hypothetical protein n=1 Tax=Pseudomyxococcus flavus TaxID=3115648 RepID=UPI003CFB03C3
MRKLVWSGVMLCGLLVGCASRQEVGEATAEAPPASSGAAPAPAGESQAPAESQTQGDSQASGAPQAVAIPPVAEGEAQAPALPLEVTANPEPKDAISIMSARVEGNVLELLVTHGGGCAEHTYTLAWDGTLQQGADGTPVANLVLVHDGNNDRCKALLRKRPRFDLSPISQRFGAQFGKASGAVNLALPDQAPVHYAF